MRPSHVLGHLAKRTARRRALRWANDRFVAVSYAPLVDLPCDIGIGTGGGGACRKPRSSSNKSQAIKLLRPGNPSQHRVFNLYVS